MKKFYKAISILMIAVMLALSIGSSYPNLNKINKVNATGLEVVIVKEVLLSALQYTVYALFAVGCYEAVASDDVDVDVLLNDYHDYLADNPQDWIDGNNALKPWVEAPYQRFSVISGGGSSPNGEDPKTDLSKIVKDFGMTVLIGDTSSGMMGSIADWIESKITTDETGAPVLAIGNEVVPVEGERWGFSGYEFDESGYYPISCIARPIGSDGRQYYFSYETRASSSQLVFGVVDGADACGQTADLYWYDPGTKLVRNFRMKGTRYIYRYSWDIATGEHQRFPVDYLEGVPVFSDQAAFMQYQATGNEGLILNNKTSIDTGDDYGYMNIGTGDLDPSILADGTLGHMNHLANKNLTFEELLRLGTDITAGVEAYRTGDTERATELGIPPQGELTNETYSALIEHLIEKASASAGESEAAIIAQELSAIASRYAIFKCKEAADAMAAYLEAEGQEYRFITMQYPYKPGIIISLTREAVYGINSEENQISTNGLHYGIEYNDTMYCNVHPNGLSLNDWLADFWGSDQTERIITAT
ncbi:MAG: hypothetical protein LBV33_05240 [Lachnospiraceae bacterium]|jgi:hypothetical protein|nr:hypothetical protein [Lachnospiraceae bacterium]